MQTYTDVINSVKKEMTKQSISNAKLSELTGISKGSISLIFNNKRKMNLDYLLKIIDVLGFNPIGNN